MQSLTDVVPVPVVVSVVRKIRQLLDSALGRGCLNLNLRLDLTTMLLLLQPVVDLQIRLWNRQKMRQHLRRRPEHRCDRRGTPARCCRFRVCSFRAAAAHDWYRRWYEYQ